MTSRDFLADLLIGIQFRIRDRLLGRIKLRPGLPSSASLARATSPGELKFYQLLLETALKLAPPGEHDISLVLDVGCRNGAYLPALARVFPEAEIIGNELDPSRRYWNLWRRGDYADARSRELSRERSRPVRFVPGDFRKIRPNDLPHSPSLAFTFFYPFVSEDPCHGWGLPSEYASFSDLLTHAQALARIASCGETRIISAHQGEWEAELAREAYAANELRTNEAVIKPERFVELWPAPYDVHVFSTTLKRLPEKLDIPGSFQD